MYIHMYMYMYMYMDMDMYMYSCRRPDVILSYTYWYILHVPCIHIYIYIYAHGQYMSIHESSTHVANLPLPVAKGALFWANPNHWDKVPRGRDLTPLLLNSDVFHMFPIVEYIPSLLSLPQIPWSQHVTPDFSFFSSIMSLESAPMDPSVSSEVPQSFRWKLTFIFFKVAAWQNPRETLLLHGSKLGEFSLDQAGSWRGVIPSNGFQMGLGYGWWWLTSDIQWLSGTIPMASPWLWLDKSKFDE